MTVYAKLNETRSALRGISSTLKIYSAQTNRDDIQKSFSEAAETIDRIGMDLDKRIKNLELEEPQYRGL